MSTEQKSLGMQDSQLLEKSEKLIWALLDDHISDNDVKQLESLIKENEAVRTRYLQCVQVHCDLYSHYQAASTEAAQAKSPVLGTLLSKPSLTQGDPSSLAD